MTKAMLIQNKRETKAGKAMVQDKEGKWVELVIPNLITGYLRPGRPVNPDSERQKRLAERIAKQEAGIEIKRGRPKMQLADVLADLSI